MKEKDRHIILEELKEICPFLAEKDPGNAYGVPAGYFDGLSGLITQKINNAPTLEKGLAAAYQLPEGYFEGLADDILSRIRATNHQVNEINEELRAIAPLLVDLGKKETYSVPAGYFEGFRVAGPGVVQKAKLVSLRRASKWMQFATAAMVAGILVTGAFIFTDKSDYLGFEKYEQLDLPSALNKVSDEDLVSYLENPEHIANTIVHESGNLTGEEVYGEVKNNLQELSDEEMDSYLSENPEPSFIISHFKK